MSKSRTALAAILLSSLFNVHSVAAYAPQDQQIYNPVSFNQKNEAQSFPECKDHNGQPVKYVNSRDYSGFIIYANVRYLDTDPISNPAIIYNAHFIESLSKLERDFTMAHECYHLSSGDAYKAYEDLALGIKRDRDSDIIMRKMEDDADCAATRELRTDYGYSVESIENLYNLFDRFENGPELERRMNLVRECANIPEASF